MTQNTRSKCIITAYKMLTEAGYKAVGHDRYSRVEWHMRENCLNGWPWGGILTTGAGCFMGYLQKFSYSNIENINEYMETVKIRKTAHLQTLRINKRRHDATNNDHDYTCGCPSAKKSSWKNSALPQKKCSQSNWKS